MSGGREWAHSKLDWLDQVADDLGSSDHLAFRVAHTIMRLTDKDTGIADWSQAELARRARASVRSLQLSIDKLEERGFIAVLPKANPRLGNRYRPTLKATHPHAQPIAHETHPHAQPIAHETHASCAASYAKSDGFKRNPLRTVSREDPRDPRNPHQPPSSDSVPRTTTTEAGAGAAAPLSDKELWAELRNAAAGNIVGGSGTRDLQPIRALMADGVNLERVILPTISSRVTMLSDPLRTWRAPWLLEAIRQQVRHAATVADLAVPPTPSVAPSLPAQPAQPVRPVTPAVRPMPHGKPAQFRTVQTFGEGSEDQCPPEQVYRVAERTITASDLRLLVNDYFERLEWPADLGPSPGSDGCLLPVGTRAWSPPPGSRPVVQIPGKMSIDEEIVWSLIDQYRQGMPWPEKWGTEPGTPGCLLPQRFQDAALLDFREDDETDG